jgi:hypothetical protein
VNTDSSSSPAEHIRRARNQRVLLWAHAAFALISAALYLNRINLGGLALSGSLFLVLLVIIPILIPYLISVVYSLRVVTADSKRVPLFVLLLTLGCTVMGCLLTGVFGNVGWGDVLSFIVVQCFAYLWGAELLLHVV